MPRRVFIRQHQSPGDILVLTAAIESLHKQFPGQFLTNVKTTCDDIWLNNPWLDKTVNPTDFLIDAQYNMINRINDLPNHFIHGFCEDIGRKLRIPLVPQVNRPFLYLTDEEKKPIIDGPYALINAGVKCDYTAKGAGRAIYQDIVEAVRQAYPQIKWVQIGKRIDIHQPLDNVDNWIDKTTHRELIRLAYGSLFGVGPVTFLHHIYGALQKPYVCYVGGREPVNWENYPTATMLNTQGQLPCCQYKACWRDRTVALNDRSKHNKSLCVLPIAGQDGEPIPSCMALLGSGPAFWAIRNMIMSGVIKI